MNGAETIVVFAPEGILKMRNSYRKITSVLGAITLMVSTFSLAAVFAPTASAQIRGLTVDFAAAEPTTYNHLIGGGQWQSGDVNKDIARSLAADNFKCGDIVSYLSRYTMDSSASITSIDPFTVTSQFNFDLDTTGQSGAILGDVIGVTIDATDPAQVGDKNSVATLISETTTGTPFTKNSELVALVDVSDLERNEVVVVRMDVKIICDPKLKPTGDLQARFKDAQLTFKNGSTPVLPPEPVGVGEKTVPLKKLNALAIPQLSLTKTVTNSTGTCPGVKTLAANSGDSIKYCYAILNTDNGSGNPPAPIYNLSDISDDGGVFPSFNVPITSGLSDQDGDGNLDDLAAGATAYGEAIKTYEVTNDTQVLNTATVFGYDSIINPTRLDATDSATLNLTAPILVPAIAINKLTNGGDGVTILFNELVVWSYQLTNTGNAPLTNISVIDDQGVTVVCPQTTLAVGQSITCDATGTAIKGPYTNNATVTANYSTVVVSATDSSSYFGAAPTMTLDKKTNGQDIAEIAVGAPITWTYLVTNTGNVAIDSIIVDDDHGVVVTCPKSALAVAESMTCSGTGVATAGWYDNIGSAHANFQGTQLTAQDASRYYGVLATMTLDKTTNGHDGGTIIKFSPIEWQYLVTNTGNVTLSNIVVVDDKGVSVSCPTTTLAPGNSTTCLGSGTAGEGDYSNIGTVTANYGPFNATATDSSSYFGAHVELTLKKFTNGAEAPDIHVGNAITWTYLVKNTGNVTVSSISVTDDQGVVVTCPKSVLAVNEEMTCSGTGIATAGWYRNLGIVNGTFEQTNVSAQDSSTYYGSAPAVTIEKLTNGSDNPTIPVGSPVVWTYQITNTGNVTIDSIVVTDNQGVSVTCPKTTLAVGEPMQCTASGTSVAGAYSNIGTVTANYLGFQVSATDGSSYFGSAPSINIQKTPDTQIVVQGGTANFTITVTNTGNIPLTGVVVTDPLVASCAKTIGALAVGEVQSYTCSLTNLQASFTNTATVVANTGPTLISAEDTADVVVDFLPDITLSKSASVTTVPAVGGPVDYTLRVTNNGVNVVTLTSLTDNKVTLSPACTALIGQTIASGAYLECVIPAVQVIWTGEPTFVNTATAVATDPQQNSDTATASATVNITAPAPAIDVQKTPDTQIVVQGNSATFTITVTNTGNVPLTNVIVADVLAPACGKTIASLAIAEVQTFTCTLNNIQSSLTNIATVSASFGQSTITDQDSADVVVDILPDITLSKSASVTTVPATGGSVDYTIRVTNIGTEAVTLTSLTDNKVTLSPACTALIGQTIAAGAYLECVIPAVSVTWNGESTFVNTATAVAKDPQQNSDTATASATVNITSPAPAIDVQKTPDTQTVAQGGSVTFTITITNTGNVPLTNIVVTDPLSTDCSRTIANLAIAQVVTFTCSLGNVQSSFTNVATVTANTGQTTITDQDAADVVVQMMAYGRTPGYWKNHPADWVSGYTPNDYIQNIFNIPTRFYKAGVLDIIAPSGKDRLIDGLSYKGGSSLDGSFQILMRAAIAALLNEAYYGSYYPGATSPAALITQVNGVLITESRANYLALASMLDNWNNGNHSSLP